MYLVVYISLRDSQRIIHRSMLWGMEFIFFYSSHILATTQSTH